MATISVCIRKEKNYVNATIHIQVYCNKQTWRLPLDISIEPDSWDKKNKCVYNNSYNANYYNKKIQDKKKQISDIIFTLEQKEIPITITAIKSELDFVKSASYIKNSYNFYEFMEQIKKQKSKQGVQSDSQKVYDTVKKQLQSFKPNLYITDINYKFISNFEGHLIGAGLKQSTIHKYLKTLKMFCKEAYYQKLISENSFENYKLKKGKTNRKHLTTEDLKKIINCTLEKDSDKRIRELFLFQCFTGIEYKSLFALRWQHIYDDRIEYIRHKTNQPIKIPFIDLSKEYIKKFIRGNDKDFVFKRISNQKYNAYLKNIEKISKVGKKLTSHVGRHTFATIALNLGMRIEVVSAILGHTTIATTQIYAEIVDKTREDDMKELNIAYNLALKA